MKYNFIYIQSETSVAHIAMWKVTKLEICTTPFPVSLHFGNVACVCFEFYDL